MSNDTIGSLLLSKNPPLYKHVGFDENLMRALGLEDKLFFIRYMSIEDRIDISHRKSLCVDLPNTDPDVNNELREIVFTVAKALYIGNGSGEYFPAFSEKELVSFNSYRGQVAIFIRMAYNAILEFNYVIQTTEAELKN